MLPCEVIPATKKPGVFLTLLNCDLVRLREAVQYQQHLFSQMTLSYCEKLPFKLDNKHTKQLPGRHGFTGSLFV